MSSDGVVYTSTRSNGPIVTVLLSLGLTPLRVAMTRAAASAISPAATTSPGTARTSVESVAVRLNCARRVIRCRDGVASVIHSR